MSNDYDHSWDLVESEEGNLPVNEELFDKKYEEWERRDWMRWLEQNLSFPFEVERMEDDDDALFTNVADYEPFRLGHKMTVRALESEDLGYGIIVKVEERGSAGYVPLCDVEVTTKSDKNYWPVKEYVVWFANK